jgi:conjugative transposon TraN protein
MTLGMLILVSTFAQTLPSYQLSITTSKTTSLIFPFTIRHVDRGTKDVLVEQIKEAENILLVKAAKPHFVQTNLTIITSDGQLYSFNVTYDSLPGLLVYRFPSHSGVSANEVKFKDRAMNAAELERTSKKILSYKKTISGIRDNEWNIVAKVNGIYVKDNVMFFQLVVENLSAIDYDIDFIRFYLRDNKMSKRTATQEQELQPVYIVGNTSKVKANNKTVIVFAFEKFTIPDAKSFLIEIAERNRGRQLLLKVKNSKIMRATALDDFS